MRPQAIIYGVRKVLKDTSQKLSPEYLSKSPIDVIKEVIKAVNLAEVRSRCCQRMVPPTGTAEKGK